MGGVEALTGPPCCDATMHTTQGEPHCTGWLPEGYPWHGCALAPGHGRTSMQTHVCQCGATWRAKRYSYT